MMMKIATALALSALTVTTGLVRADELLKFRIFMHVTGVQTQEVPDVDGHTMSVIKFSGLASFSDGAVGTATLVATTDYTLHVLLRLPFVKVNVFRPRRIGHSNCGPRNLIYLHRRNREFPICRDALGPLRWSEFSLVRRVAFNVLNMKSASSENLKYVEPYYNTDLGTSPDSTASRGRGSARGEHSLCRSEPVTQPLFRQLHGMSLAT
jgi:hypothetical protein